jgi:glycine betaine catabolism A
MSEHRHPQSPLLDHCPESLPARAYLDADWYAREQATIWAKNWICAGRLNDLAPGSMRRVQVGAAATILCRGADGTLSAFHNVCRHRGAELCRAEQQPMGKLVACPYHAWAYAPDDGRLVSVAHATPTDDFVRADNGLFPVSVTTWAGFVFLNLMADPGPLVPDVGRHFFDNWPMDSLKTGHRMVKDCAFNWKLFWENYNECLHCPTIHPELCDLVPVYSKGIMAANEAVAWTPDQPVGPNLRAGAQSWTMTGAPCGPVFARLTPEERQNGYNFATLYPTMFIVAHVDYVRAVRLEPLGPQTTRLTAEWYFSQETLDQPGFDAARVADFAKIVLGQDTAAAEMNQRGLASPAFTAGRLMPQEFDMHRFQAWVLDQMGGAL